MNKMLLTQIKAINDTNKLNGIVVNSYLVNNHLSVKKGVLYDTVKPTTEVIEGIATLEDVIEVFESVIPTDDKTTNGAIYTPKFIRDYIVSICSKTNKNFYNETFAQ